jgi:hypothetical protein
MNLVFAVTVIQSLSLKAPFIILSAVESIIAFSKSDSNGSNFKISMSQTVSGHEIHTFSIMRSILSKSESNTDILFEVKKSFLYMRIQAKTIVLKNQLIATNTENEFLYKHFNAKLGFARINLVSKCCTCHKYLDKGVCKHLIVACIQTRSNLPGLVQLPKKFKIVRRKKNRRYIDDSSLCGKTLFLCILTIKIVY